MMQVYKSATHPQPLPPLSETVTYETLSFPLCRRVIINVPAIRPVYARLPSRIEWRLCAAVLPSRGVLVLPVSKHPLDTEPGEGEQGPQCLPAPSALSWRRLPPWLPAPNPT